LELQKILGFEESTIRMNSTNLSSSAKFDPENVLAAEGSTLDDVLYISPTSALPETESSWRQKGDSQAPIGPSLLLSDSSIPKSTYVSSSKRTTGQQSSSANGTAGGQYAQASGVQSEKSSPLAGLPYAEMTNHRYPKALDKQIGGSHYKDFALQPIEFIHKNNIGFIAGNVIKYVCRYAAKDGLKDLEKARHYIDILIEQERNETNKT
jgi:uncharacterized protein DUF3310